MILFLDTETTGWPLSRSAPLDHPEQPHLVQLAAVLCQEDGTEVDRCVSIVRPDGWVIPEQASAVHGITTERALAEGRPELDVMTDFARLFGRATLRVAHNESFDCMILRIAIARYGSDADLLLWDGFPAYCTMREATPVCQIPPTARMQAKGMKAFKSPNLQEAHRILFGEEFDGAHDALADVLACKRVYLHLISGDRSTVRGRVAA